MKKVVMVAAFMVAALVPAAAQAPGVIMPGDNGRSGAAAHAGEQKYSCLATGMDKPVEVRIVNDEVLIYDGSPIPITPPINATKSTSGWRMLNGRADLGAWDYNTKRLIFNGSPSFVLNCVS